MIPVLLAAATGLALPLSADPDLASYFGFDAMRTIVVDRGCGPVAVGDFNGDKRPDLAVVNNAKSRIEVYLLRDKEKTPEELEQNLKVNQFTSSPWYDRVEVSVPQRITALRPFDVDGDGRLDIVYVGQNPAEVVVLQQRAPAAGAKADAVSFKVMTRQRVRGLGAGQSGLRIADVMGDERPEVITVAEDKLIVLPLGKDGVLGEPRRLPTDKQAAGSLIEDYNGDGLLDILGVVADEQTPIRLWLQKQDPGVSGQKRGLLGAELRFESPALRDIDPVRFAGQKAASIGVIERLSRRVVFYDFVTEPIEPMSAGSSVAEREVQAEAYGFADGSSKDRAVAIIDVDGDGLQDLLATDAKNNTIVLYRQRPGIGLGDAEPFSAFKAPKALAGAPGHQWDDSATAKVFVLSEDEKAVGVADWDAKAGAGGGGGGGGKLGFPSPIGLKTAGAVPVAMGHAVIDGVGTLGIIVKDKRDHTLELHQPSMMEADGSSSVVVVPLKNVTRPPQSLIACDADQDGATDVLLFTPSEPMIMVRGTPGQKGKPTLLLTDKEMPSFGLVQAAQPNNTALVDMDGDGKAELVIADKNFVRACRYDAKTGWKVVGQITVTDPGTGLAGLTVLKQGDKEMLVASDKANNRLLFMSTTEVVARMRLSGFSPSAIYAGQFGGDGQPGILCLADDAFGLTRLAGTRLRLEQFAAFRSDARDRAEFDLEFGDINADGFTDALIADAGAQMCSILTFTAGRKVRLATEFEIYQSRLFSGGEGRELEPRDMIITDATGDGRDDLVLLIHDRIIVHPQATRAK